MDRDVGWTGELSNRPCSLAFDVIVGDVAHLLFYSEQPDANGRVEFVITARLAAPIGKDKAAIQVLASVVRTDRGIREPN